MGSIRAQPLEGISVLVVDDNEDARDLIRTTLMYYGALTVTAENGKDALERLASTRVDVIVSDISMPGFSGHDLIRAVRALPSHAGHDTPAIALTAFNEPHQRRRALEAGFQVYMVKPFDPTTLVNEIAAVVGRDAADD